MDHLHVPASPSLTLAVALALAAAFTAPAGARLISLEDVAEEVRLPVGRDLVVSWAGAEPKEWYRLEIADEAQAVVAQAWVEADDDGVVAPFRLWAATGVVGCDAGVDPDPASYRFARLEEAAAALAGRVFSLGLEDAETGTEVQAWRLELVETKDDVFYFSDGSGCPRFSFDPGETVFVSGYLETPTPLWLFLIRTSDPLEKGDPLVDVRDEPQRIVPLRSAFIEPVATGFDLYDASARRCPTHTGLVRKTRNPQPPLEVYRSDEIVVSLGTCGGPAPSFATGSSGVRVREGDKVDCGPGGS